MKKLFSTILLSLPGLLFAQKITISEDIPLRNDVAYEIVGHFKDRLLLFRDRVNQFEIQAFDNRMRETWSKELNLEKRSPKVIGIVPSEEDFTVFYRHRDKNHLILKANRYDPAANLRDTMTLKDFGFMFYTPNFEVIKSEDKTKALIYFVENQQNFRVVSYDVVNMKVLWEKSFFPENMNFWEEFHQIIVSNDGTMFLILQKNRYRFRRDNNYHEIFQVNASPETPMRFAIPMGEERFTYDVAFAYDNMNNQLVAAGLYTEKNLDRANGYFYIRMTPETEGNYLLTFEEFDDEFVTNLRGKNIENNKGVLEVAVQDVVLRRDGGAVLVCERTRELARSLGANRAMDIGVRQIVDHYYDELFVISLHPDGTTHWRTILHKKQYSQDDNGIYSSFFLFKSPTSLRLLFNDEIKFENTVSEYIVFGNGNFDRKSLLSTENLDLRLRFRDATQISSDELIIPSERRSRLRLVKLQYQ